MDRLRATFIAGTSTGLRAQELFTNRLNELVIFREALALVRQISTARQLKPSLDISIPRRNVLVYYGFGGIGKTALSKQLELLFLDGSFTGRTAKRVAVRVDFGEAGDFDLETILLRMRAGLGTLRRKWSAFDAAFTLYWQRIHPGEPLPEFVRQNSTLRQNTERFDFSEQMQDALVQILSEVGMAWAPSRIALRLGSLTHERLSRSLRYRHLVAACPFFEPIVTADDPRETLSYMASLLAWELDEVMSEDEAHVVVFFDTFETVTDRSTREIERLTQRILYLMPTVMFVVTGRNRLDWAELSSSGELDYVGISRWPQLHYENTRREPRQHLIGSLSAQDCDIYLRGALQDENGMPALDEDIRRRIIDGSGGLPLYLDLAITQYLELTVARQAIDPSEFGGSLSSIVTRIMRNLNQEERNLLRGVSLLDSFDIRLARAASGSSDAVAARFINCSLVVHTIDLAWPYSLHALLRTSVQDTDQELRDAWSPREWQAAAERICEHLGQVSDRARDIRDSATVASCFVQAARITISFDLSPAWLLDAAQFLADAGLWRVLDVRFSVVEPQSSAAISLLEGLRGIATRRDGALETSIGHFDRALSSPSLTENARNLLRLHRAHSVRNSGRYGEAEVEYREVANADSIYSDRAKLQLADLQLLRGEFTPALRSLDALPSDAEFRGEALRIRGHVLRANCDLEAGELIYRRALVLGRETGSPALEGKALTNLAETICWLDGTEGEKLANAAIEFNQQVGNQLEVLKATAAKAIAAADNVSREAVLEALRISDVCGYRAGRIFAYAARLFHELRSGHQGAAATVTEIRNLTDSIGVYYYWREIARWWCEAVDPQLAQEEPGVFPRADWMGLPELARSRWVKVIRQSER